MPVTAVARAKRRAARRVRRPRTSGRLRVRDIFASCSGSKAMLKALADEAVRNVPEVRKRRVMVLKEGAVVVLGSSIVGTG